MFRTIPAILDLAKIYSIGETNISHFIDILDKHKDVNALGFIINYFHIEPEFIVLMYYMYHNKIEFFKSYRSAEKCCFGSASDKPTVDDWKMLFKRILEGIKYDELAKNHDEVLKSLSSKMINQGSFDTKHCIYTTILAVCVIKSWTTYEKVLLAINAGYKKGFVTVHDFFLPSLYVHFKRKDKKICDEKKFFQEVISHVFGKNLSEFSRLVIDLAAILHMSANFDSEIVRKVLLAVSFVFANFNVMKKIVVFFGDYGTGKSLLCNLIQEMCYPSVTRANEMTDLLQRSNESVRQTVFIVNEMNYLDPNVVKSISGNDPETAKIFYKQENELMESQCVIYGATNNLIRFRNSFRDQSKIDCVAVKRFLVIKLTGQQVNEGSTEDATESNFNNLIEGKYKKGSISVNNAELGATLAFCSFFYYEKHRDDSFCPLIDTKDEDLLKYQEQVFVNNNALYGFIRNCGFIHAIGFYINKSKFLKIISRGIEKKSRVVPTMNDFILQFQENFGIDLQNVSTDTVTNFHFYVFVEHVKCFMETTEVPGARITSENLELRLSVYINTIDKEVARAYFRRMNKHYFSDNKTEFVGIRFKKEDFLPYDGYKANTDWYEDTQFYMESFRNTSRNPDHDDADNQITSNNSMPFMTSALLPHELVFEPP
ncbi:uncharacterized protein [Bemisia tabaci]